MRLRSWLWILLCLLIAAGAWFFWRPANPTAEMAAHQTVSTAAHPSSPAPNLPAGATAAAKANQAGVVKTNRFAYRLANTSKPIGELVNDRHAILLENALIDTSGPLNLSIPKQLQAQGDAGAYIVQARGPANAAFRALLAQAGATEDTFKNYIPNNAYLTRLSPAAAESLKGSPLVQAVLPYEPYYKISASIPVAVGPRTASSTSKETHQPAGPSLLTLALMQAPLPVGTYLTLGLFGNNAAATVAQIEKLGGKILARDNSPFGPVVRVQPPEDWVALATLPGVQIVEPFHPRIHANDLSRARTSVAADSQVSSNYLGLTGKNVIVAVPDSGIDATHPDLTGRVLGLTPGDLMDTNGHGTHVAGTIAGDGTESMTVTNARGSIMPATNGQFRGMAPAATLLSMGLGANSDQQLQAAAALTNALISNNSWNNDGNTTYDLAAASYDAATRDALPEVTGSQPVLFVFSAGNDGGGDDSSDPGDGTADTILSPATAKDVIAVGAIQEHRNITNIVTTITVNSDGTTTTNSGMIWQPETSTSYRVAGFSARGNVGIGTEGTYGRFKPDVVAPGTFVISTRSSQWDIANYFLINPTNHDIATYSNVVVQPDALWASIFPTIPGNTVGISIAVGSNPDSPSPFPSLPIYAGLYTSPNLYDFSTTVNPFVIPGNPDATFTLQDILNTEGFWGFNFAVSNSTAQPVSFDVTTDVITTNNPGDYFLVLSNLDQSIGGLNPNSTGPGPYYRYETGTSMSAADVSGVLALMQQYFTNNFGITPSPALMKAALINGARVSNAQVYNLQVTNTINHEGWGLVNLTNSLPGVIADQFNTPCDDFFVDQSPTNALATGDSHTYTVIVSTNSGAQIQPLRVTLAWTDPPGNPAAAIKLVNSLEVVVTNSDNPSYPIVYYGNDIGAGQNFNTPENPTNAANVDAINNVQNVFIYPLPGADYSITVIGRQVNVNAVTQQKNNVVQDYALVISYGEGEATNAISVTDNGIVSNPAGDQQISFATSTNQPLFNQFVGAASPLLGTNAVQLGSVDGQVTAGMTNQWHFYVMTNNALDRSGVNTDVTNAVFITFDANTLSIPREGVFANSTTNATRPQADIDLYVASGPNASGLTNLDPMVISNCVNGTQVGNSVGGVFNGAALTRGGTEFVVDTNSTPGQVYYIGVKSEDRMASEYAFIPIFTSIPPSGINANGDEVVNGLNVPVAIPDGTPAHPGLGLVFGVAMYPIQVERVVVTNQVWHQNFGDLIGTLTLNGSLPDVLNNHDSVGNTIGLAPLTYDDSGQNDIGGSRPSDGPGSLNNYVGQGGFGVWELAEADDSPAQIGTNESLSLLIQPHRSLTGGLTNTIPGHSWSYNYIDVPPGYTNLSVFGTNLPPTSVPPLRMYLNINSRPTFANFLAEADLTNSPPGQPAYPAGLNPGNSISYGPPLAPGRYWVGVTNPDSATHEVYLLATLGGILTPVPTTDFSANGLPLPDDAVTPTSIFVGNTQLISSVNVALVVDHPRISDLTFTLVSPTGQRVLLMENRGGVTATNLGHFNVTTDFFGAATSGDASANTNAIGPVPNLGTLVIDYDFFTQPDSMDVYYDGVDIFSTTSLNPPSGLISGAGTFTVPYGPGVSTNIVVIMNQNGNPGDTNDQWTYTPRVISKDYNYVTFTENTNLTDTPIKFAVPPYDLPDTGTNFTISDFESATGGEYLAPANIFDPFGGWSLFTNQVFAGTNLVSMSNQVSVVTDPSTAQSGSNYLALADGSISRTIPLTVGRKYSLAYLYRGPGISGWWRGEGNALDSADPESLGNNASLVGRFNYPAGEVVQAFEFADAGQAMEFAGTNTYVQIRQAPSLDVGVGVGFTVEGWINPTNVTFQQPLVEWLARVPTNAAVTNLVIVAGPYLNRATDHYYYLLGATNWTVSEFWAEQLGGHLATIETANEQNWIRDAFGNFGNTNRNLWIGLTNSAPGRFVWSSGLTNVVYTNWANGQPLNCDTAHSFTFMLGATNAPGLWTLADNNGFICGSAATNQVFGVVEVNDIQTNGVQFWISATNTPDTANAPFMTSNGCLYANIMDTNNVAHEIFSAPGLIQSNVYQHVALTYNTNSGLAMLYYNGINVARTNLGVFVPKTGGDVLLGRDMSRATNNYFGGEMDEMSIYSRALSPSEIHAIYEISALSSNRNVGKFDQSVTPAEGLAEARVSLGGITNTIFGVNKGWQVQGFTFTAVTNSLPLQITGVEPGMLLDSFGLSEAPIGNVYYLPEQSLSELAGNSAYGNWTLQIWDNRAGAYVTNAAQLINWQLQFVLQTNGLAPTLALNPQDPATITVPPRGIIPLLVNVPSWASSATNLLVSATGPVDLLFNSTVPPTGAIPPDANLLGNSTGGKGNPDLNGTSVPPLPANSYYLGVRNNSAQTITAVVEVDFNITTLSNGVPVGGVLNPTDQERYFAYDVSSNAFEATFQLLHLSGNADLVVRKGPPLPTLLSSDYGSFSVSNADENIYVLTNTQPVPLSPGRWYLGVFKRDTGPVNYTVLAKELDAASGTPGYTVIDLTNRVPFNFTAGPGTALTNFFRFNVANTFFLTTNAANGVTTNAFGSIHFELYNLSGDGDLTVQTDAPPFAPPFFESSRQPDREPELIVIRTNSVLTNLVAPWYLGVPNNETNLITYTIVAVLDTNLVFPAFPGAEGAGAGAIGGRFGGVYHVSSLADSGAGTLRDAVSVTNRTIVFDVSGTIYLQSPLVITNSFLTVAGQTAPGDGITVAGNMTVVQSAHDVVIRYVRFRPSSAGGVFSLNGVEGTTAADYTSGQVVANSGWKVLANQVSVVTDPVNAYGGNNFLALANGVISNTLPTVAGNTYTFTFAYRGPGIAGWWRAENNASDSINGDNGSVTDGSVGYAPAEVGQGFNFDGGSNRLIVADVPVLDFGPNRDFSIEAWIQPLHNPGNYSDLTGEVMTLISKRYAPDFTTVYGYEMYLGTGRLCFQMIDTLNNGGNYYNLGTESDLRDGKFHHVVVSVQRNSTTGLRFYVDGQLAVTFNPTSVKGDLSNSWPLRIGNHPTPGINAFYHGVLDEASIYGRALSLSECKAIYAGGIVGKFDPGVYATSPAQSLSEAQVSVNGQTQGTLYGNNTNWQVKTITFTATQNGTPVQISGVEPGMLLDAASASVNADDALRLTNVSDVVADHVSTSWSTNNDLSVLNSTNVTVQWSMMADSIYDPLHPHGYGSRLRYGNGALAFHHNLYADNYNASPRLGDNLTLDFVNNVIYNWGLNAGFSTNDVADNPSGFTNELNYACNYLIAGPNSVMTNIAFWSGTPNTWIFQTNNFMDSNLNGILDGADTGWSMFTNQYTPLQVPFPPLAESIDEAFLAYERVLDFAGAAMDKRDAADTNIVGGVRGQTGVIISAPGPLPALNSLLPFLDTDRDGIPDFWEITFGQNPTNASNNQLSTNPNLLGYTDLEEYLAWLAGPHALTVTNTSVGVDLMQMFGKTGNLSFSVTNGVQGFVYLTNVLNYTNNLGIVTSFTNTGAFSNSIAVFTPTNNAGATTNYSGYAGFDVFVTNNSTIAYFGPVTVSVVVSAVPIAYAKTNTPPVLSTNIPVQTVNELAMLTVTNTATDANTNLTLTYTVTMSVDTNAMIASNWPTIYATTIPPAAIDANGIITWTPSEAQGPGVYTITTIVTDNGFPPLSATNNFTVVVNETNAAPFWPPGVPSRTNYFVNELASLTVTNTASDSDIPTNALTYTLTMSIDTNAMIASNWPTIYATTNPPAVIDTNGIITWTPGEAQGPGVYILTTVVTDTNIYALANQSLSATNRITVTVNETNSAPFWPPGVPSQTNYVVNELTLLTVANTATDLDIPPNPLTYRLIGPPGAGIDPNSGIITWTPTEAQGPGFYTFTTIVTDTNIYALTNRSLSATNRFTVTVNEVNTPPFWTNNFPLVTMDEMTTNLVNAAALDADLPPNTLTYALTNSPTWAVINSSSGIITLTPQETDGPGTNVITVTVTDNGVPPLSATTNFTVVVNEVNTAPFWPPNVPSQTNYVIYPLSTLVVANTATDLDIPPNPLTYQLLCSPAVTNATINPTNGIITWTPTLAQAPGLYTFTTIVTDTNIYALTNRSLSATNSFTVTVLSVSVPFVFTQPATSVTGTNAQLNGMATPNGLPTTVWFEWGTSTLYGNQTPPVGIGNSLNVVYAPGQISGLTLNVPYHFRMVASNLVGVVYGFDQILDEANVVVWGADYVGQAEVPAGLSNAVAIAGAYDHSLALKNNGTAAAWGDNTFGQATVPAGLSNLLAVAGGEYYSVALKNSGTVAAWGANILGQTNVPSGLSNVVTVAGGTFSTLALQTNGAVAAWGANFFNLTNVPAGLNNAVAIAGGSYHNLAVRNDGTVTAWGDNSAGQLNVPAGLTNVVAIAGGSYHSLALLYNGTVVAWGDNSAGQINVPAGLSNVVAVAAGGFHSLALKSDGSVVAWGDDSEGQISVPPGLTNFVAISAGYFHSLGLTPQAIASLTNIVLNLTNDVPRTNSISGGGIIYYQVNVPANADFATNSLLFTLNGPLNVWFTTNSPPTIATNATLLLSDATSGSSILSLTSAPTNIVPGSTYYLGVQNTNHFSVSYGIGVNFHLVTATNGIVLSGIIYTNIAGTNGFLLTWFAPSNDLFQVQWSGSLPPVTWTQFTNIVSYNPNFPASAIYAQFNFFDDGSQTGGTLGPLRFYRLILLGGPTNQPPPVLPLQTNRVINPLTPLIVTNTASDAAVPAPVLTYTLTSTVTGTNPPVINPTNGVITWTPDVTQAGTSNIFTTIVTASGLPALSATNSFAVVVNPLPVLGNVIYTNGGFLLTWFAPTNDQFRVQFTDSLAPQNWQSFSNIIVYTGPPTPTNGLFSFFDDGSQYPFGGPRFYRLILLGLATPTPANPPPVLPLQTNRVINPLTPLIVTNTASDAAVPAPVLTYTLTSTVTGTNPPVINPTNGVITWTPDVTQAGTSNIFTTIVTASGVPALSATNSFAVVVNPLPVLGNVIYTNGGFLLTWFAPTNDQFRVQFTDSLAPQNWQSFSNIIVYTGPPTPTNGLFSFFDDGSQYPFGGPRFYRLILLGLATPTPANPPPVLPLQTNRVINPLTPLIVTNTASDAAVPAPVLTYTLTSTVTGTNPPVINPTNGVITWTPDVTQAGTSNIFTTIVTASGVPALSATNSFAVVVNPLPVLGNVIYTNGGFLLTWFAPTNDQFRVQFTDSLAPQNWQSFSNIIVYTGPPTPTNGLFSFFDDGSQYPFGGPRFYRLILLGLATPTPANPPPVLPLQTNRVINPLTPLIVTNTASDAAVPAPVLTYTLTSTVTGTNPPVINPTNGVITWTPDVTQAGTSNIFTTIVTASGVPALSATNSFAVVVNPLPVLGNVIYTNGGFLLTWFAPTNDQFKVEWNTNLASPANWPAFPGIVTSTNGTFSFTDTNVPLVLRFYRLLLLP